MMYSDVLEIDIRYLHMTEERWNQFIHKLRWKHRKIEAPEVGKIRFLYKNRGLDEFQIRAFVMGYLSEFMDKHQPLILPEILEERERILPIDEKPESTTYLFYSTKLCIIQAQESLKQWLLQNFITIKLYYQHGNMNSFFFQEEMEDRFVFERKTFDELRDMENVIEYTREQLDQGHYVNIHLDEFYLSEKDVFQRQHHVHENLIYGYNDYEKVFYAYGFVKEQRMEAFSIPYEEYLCGYEKGKLFFFCGAGYLAGAYPWPIDIRYLKPCSCPDFTGEIFADCLRDYLYPHPQEMVEGDLHIYGKEVCSYIIRCLRSQADNPVDFRTFQLLHEQKQCILRRVEYLTERYEIQTAMEGFLKDYRKIAASYKSMKLLYLRVLRTENVDGRLDKALKDEELNQKLATNMESLCQREEMLLLWLEEQARQNFAGLRE